MRSQTRPEATSLLTCVGLSLLAFRFLHAAVPAPVAEPPPPPGETPDFSCHLEEDPEKRKDTDLPSDPVQRDVCLSSAFQVALQLKEQGKSDKAPRLMRMLAAEGYAPAQWQLGWMYESGEGVPVDLAEAAKWYREAAEQGYAPAQVFLGVAYELGQGVPTDYRQAVAWLRKAADQQLPLAEYRLGSMYWEGLGVPKDTNEAIRLWRMAADHGSSEAQFILGLHYVRGEGVARDYTTAVKLLRQSAQQGNAAGQIALGSRYLQGQGVPRNQVQAYKWFTLAISGLHDPKDENLALARRDRDAAARGMTAAEVVTATQLADKCQADKYKDCD